MWESTLYILHFEDTQFKTDERIYYQLEVRFIRSYYEQYCQLINGELITICEENDNISFFDGAGGTISEEEYQMIVGQCTYGQSPVRPFQEYYPNTAENRELYLAAGMGEESTIHAR